MQSMGTVAPIPQEASERLPTFPALPVDGQERDIVQRARVGDQQALGQLYDIYFPRIYRYVLARTGNTAEAEDVTEDVFIKVLGAIGGFEWREAPFAAWIFRIAHNQLVSHSRKNGAHRTETPLADTIADPAPDPLLRVENRLSFEQVLDVARALPQAQREVLWLRFAVGLSVCDTARTLGKQENNVKVLQHKAIAGLQKLLGPSELERTNT